MLKNNEATRELAAEGKKTGYLPYWVVGVLAADQRGENVSPERLEEALRSVGAFKALRTFQAADGEWYYCPRHKEFQGWVRSAMDEMINGRTRSGARPDLSDPKRRSAFLAALSRVEKTWREEYSKEAQLSSPKRPQARRKTNA